MRPKPRHLGDGVLCRTAIPTSTIPSIISTSNLSPLSTSPGSKPSRFRGSNLKASNASEHFLAQNFSQGSTEASKDGGSLRPADSSTASEQCSRGPPPSSPTGKASRPTGGGDSFERATREIQIRHAPGPFVHDKPLKNCCRLLLRRRRVQMAYLDRDTAALGGRRPGAEWRWCGFDGCSKEACRYHVGGGVGVEDLPVLLLAPTDLEAEYRLLRELNSAFEAAGLHRSVFVAFATSPPVVRAMAEYISSVVDGKGSPMKSFCCAGGVLDMAADKSKGEGWAQGPESEKGIIDDGPPPSLSTPQGPKGSADRRDEPSFYQHDSETDTARDRVFRAMMRLDGWRRRQVAVEAYPWDWDASGAAAYKTVIGAYCEAYGRGDVVLREAGRNAQDRAWTLWWDRFRPWAECKGPFVADLEAADMEARNEAGRGDDDDDDDDDGEEDVKDDEDEDKDGNDDHKRASIASDDDLYEGVGRYMASWWPNQPRAPGVDLSLEH
ncbi:hypothetical protein CTA2_5333 [Colletotrichum tanaceti]|nr:hypothetical protein CTA2_5324 [Colletotrichum tanaceti]KAJ0166908.1 hypothetical protein CTA2_5333 [Colletotrichum tanaceti]